MRVFFVSVSIFILSLSSVVFTYNSLADDTPPKDLIYQLDLVARHCGSAENNKKVNQLIAKILADPTELINKEIVIGPNADLNQQTSYRQERHLSPLEYLLMLRNVNTQTKYLSQTGTIDNDWIQKNSCHAKIIAALMCHQVPRKTKKLIENFITKCDFDILPILRQRLVVDGCGNSNQHPSDHEITNSDFLESQSTVDQKMVDHLNNFSDLYFKTKIEMLVKQFIEEEAFPLKNTKKFSQFLKGFQPNLSQNIEPPPLIISKVKAFENPGQNLDPMDSITIRSHLRILLFQEIQSRRELKNILLKNDISQVIVELEKSDILRNLKKDISENIIDKSEGDLTNTFQTNDPWAMKNWARKLKQTHQNHATQQWQTAFLEIRDEVTFYTQIKEMNSCDPTRKWLDELRRGYSTLPLSGFRNKIQKNVR